jgi:hypothetical protein
MSDPALIIAQGLTINPATTNVPDGQDVTPALGKQGETLTSPLHGPQYAGAMRGNVFNFVKQTQTIPTIASGLVNTFALYNPSTSNKVAELIDFDLGLIAGAPVINVIGLYWQGAPVSGQATFTTPAVFGTNVFGGSPARGQPVIQAYTGLTHLTGTTPVRIAVLFSENTTSVIVAGSLHYEFKGKVVLYPGDIVGVATSTGAQTTAALGISWAEWPYPT